MFYPIRGTIDYHTKYCVAWIDNNLVAYYRSLVPKYKYAQKPMYPAHCTIVSKYDSPDQNLWRKYQGETIEIWYENCVQEFGPYFGINAFCKRIEEIRLELGLSLMMGDHNCYHITVGNNKNEIL